PRVCKVFYKICAKASQFSRILSLSFHHPPTIPSVPIYWSFYWRCKGTLTDPGTTIFGAPFRILTTNNHRAIRHSLITSPPLRYPVAVDRGKPAPPPGIDRHSSKPKPKSVRHFSENLVSKSISRTVHPACSTC